MEEKQDLLEGLYQKEYKRLLKTAYDILHDEYDAEDAVAEVFITIIRHKVWWKKQNENVRIDYAIKICEKICKEFYEKRIKRKQVEYKEDKLKTCIDVEFEKVLLEHEDLYKLFNFLNEPDKQIFIARYIDGRSVKDIAAQYNTAENNISKRLSRGRKVLKERLKRIPEK